MEYFLCNKRLSKRRRRRVSRARRRREEAGVANIRDPCSGEQVSDTWAATSAHLNSEGAFCLIRSLKRSQTETAGQAQEG